MTTKWPANKLSRELGDREGKGLRSLLVPFPFPPPTPPGELAEYIHIFRHTNQLCGSGKSRDHQVSVRCHGINREFDTVSLEKEKRNYSQVQFDSIILWWPVWRVRQRNQSHCAAKSKALQYHDRNVTSCISHASRQLHHITSHPGHWKTKVQNTFSLDEVVSIPGRGGGGCTCTPLRKLYRYVTSQKVMVFESFWCRSENGFRFWPLWS